MNTAFTTTVILHNSASGNGSAGRPFSVRAVRFFVSTDSCSADFVAPLAAPIGRSLIPYSELYAHVPAVFRFYRRCYHNRFRRDFKLQLQQLSSLQLIGLREFPVQRDYYSPAAKKLIVQRLREILPLATFESYARQYGWTD